MEDKYKFYIKTPEFKKADTKYFLICNFEKDIAKIWFDDVWYQKNNGNITFISHFFIEVFGDGKKYVNRKLGIDHKDRKTRVFCTEDLFLYRTEAFLFTYDFLVKLDNAVQNRNILDNENITRKLQHFAGLKARKD